MSEYFSMALASQLTDAHRASCNVVPCGWMAGCESRIGWAGGRMIGSAFGGPSPFTDMAGRLSPRHFSLLVFRDSKWIRRVDLPHLPRAPLSTLTNPQLQPFEPETRWFTMVLGQRTRDMKRRLATILREHRRGEARRVL